MSVWLLVVWALLCGFEDATYRRLPNVLTLGGHVVAVLALVVTGQSLLGAGSTSALLAWLLALVLTVPAYICKWLGAGDVKMLAAMGLLVGLNIMLTSYAIAGLLTLVLIFGGLMWRRTQPWLNLKLARIHCQLPAVSPSGGRQIPFGALLAFGLIIALVLLETGLISV